uniref:Uncharacterized protein n=1 Tax=Phaffia rhodozyma TaxID=264483 RepID=Q9HFD4_PHARH|nr:hypothetical protein [Phaffia rhodozyma]
MRTDCEACPGPHHRVSEVPFLCLLFFLLQAVRRRGGETDGERPLSRACLSLFPVALIRPPRR